MSRNVKVTFPGGKKVDAEIRGHVIHTDQAKPSGGQDTAPEPFDLFLASIATCAGIYAMEFCNTRAIPTQGLALELVPERDETMKMFSKISLTVTPPENFPAKYRDALKRAVDLCAVKKHIMHAPQFEIVVK